MSINLTKEYKIKYILKHIDNLDHDDKLKIANILWSYSSIRDHIKDKGDGMQIKVSYLTVDSVNKIYEHIKQIIETNIY